MLRNYLKIAFRNLLKNKVYSFLNITGLALGIAACFFIFQYIHFEKSYDSFIASLIAIPVVYFAADKWLSNYAFHIELNVIIFVIPVLLLLAIALFTISLQTLRAAFSNPVTSLRSE